MSNTVLILGASGKIGLHSAKAFSEAGWQVRLFDRAKDDMTQAAMGADVIVNGLNPPHYHDWARQIPAITAQVIAAARASGATVIVPGNVYVYGDQPGPWRETTPHRPNSRKGQIRSEMERAYAKSGVQTILLRAGDFIDPAHNGDVINTVVLKSIARGKITSLGDVDAAHAHVWLPDWARAAVALADKRADLATFEDIPMPGETFSIRELQSGLEAILNRTLRVSHFPWWMMRLAAPFWELARELLEMRYLWSVPHRLSGEKFDRLLPAFQPTPRHEVLAGMLPAEVHPDQTVATGGQHRVVT